MLTFSLWGPQAFPHWGFTESFIRLFWDAGWLWGFCWVFWFLWFFVNCTTYFSCDVATELFLTISNRLSVVLVPVFGGLQVFLLVISFLCGSLFGKWISPVQLIWPTLFCYHLTKIKERKKKKRETFNKLIFIKNEIWGNTGLLLS